jgi:hypothetical protein
LTQQLSHAPLVRFAQGGQFLCLQLSTIKDGLHPEVAD